MFFFFFFFFPDAKSWGCGLYTGAVYTTVITVVNLIPLIQYFKISFFYPILANI